MVNWSAQLWLLAVDAPSKTVLEQLDPQRRVAVVLALLGLGLLGALLVTLIMLAGRWARHDYRPRRGGGPPEPRRPRMPGRGPEGTPPQVPRNQTDTVADSLGNDTSPS